MPFVLPTFNLTCNIYHYATWFGNFPGTIPAADATSPCNLAWGRRVTNFEIEIAMWLLLPAFTDIRGELNEGLNSSHGDIIEVPQGSGRFYGCFQVDDAGKGFANEHRWAILSLVNPFKPVLPAWPIPYP